MSAQTHFLLFAQFQEKGVSQNLCLLAMRESLQEELHTSLRLITKTLPLSEAVEFGFFPFSVDGQVSFVDGSRTAQAELTICQQIHISVSYITAGCLPLLSTEGPLFPAMNMKINCHFFRTVFG